MIYVNDCSISLRVVRSCIKIFVQEIFVQILYTKIILQRKKANYGSGGGWLKGKLCGKPTFLEHW